MSSKRWVLYLAATAFGLVLFFAGLYPFDFHQPNRVVLSARNGLLHFQKPSYASVVPLPDSLRRLATGPFTIEVGLSTSGYQSHSVPQIVSVYGPDYRNILVIGQWKSGAVFLFHDRAAGKQPHFGISDAFKNEKPVVITLRSTSHETTVYRNGRLEGSWPVAADLNAIGSAREMVLGNAASGKEPWTGDLYGIRFYDRALAPAEIARPSVKAGRLGDAGGEPPRGLVFDLSLASRPYLRGPAGMTPAPRLEIPALFRAPAQGLLTPPWIGFKLDESFIKDTVINLVGFLPAGVLAALILLDRRFRPGWSVLFAGASCGSVSLAIELLQVLLPSRTSALSDLFLNTLGAVIGACLACRFAHPMARLLTPSPSLGPIRANRL